MARFEQLGLRRVGARVAVDQPEVLPNWSAIFP